MADENKEKEGEDEEEENEEKDEKQRKIEESIDALKKEQERLTQDVIDLRKFRRAEKIETEKEEGKKEEIKEDEIDKKIESRLSERDKIVKTNNFERAKEIFYQENPEFSPENDTANIRFNGLMKKYGEFNNQTLFTVEDYQSRLNDALLLMKRTSGKSSEEMDEEEASSSKVPSSLKTGQKQKLTSEEKELAKTVGLSEEAFIRQRNRFGSV